MESLILSILSTDWSIRSSVSRPSLTAWSTPWKALSKSSGMSSMSTPACSAFTAASAEEYCEVMAPILRASVMTIPSNPI